MTVFVESLKFYGPLIDLLIAVFWAIFVVYTIRTFKEIKRQTDLQSEAFLVVSCKTTESRSLDEIRGTTNELYDKWHGILQTNIPDALQRPSYICLTLQNKGRSDIVEWTIKMTALVKPGTHLHRTFNIGGDSRSWTINNKGSAEIIEAGESIEIVVLKSGVFPQLVCSWDARYRDIREVSYTRFAGDKIHNEKNVLADPSPAQVTPA